MNVEGAAADSWNSPRIPGRSRTREGKSFMEAIESTKYFTRAPNFSLSHSLVLRLMLSRYRLSISRINTSSGMKCAHAPSGTLNFNKLTFKFSIRYYTFRELQSECRGLGGVLKSVWLLMTSKEEFVAGEIFSLRKHLSFFLCLLSSCVPMSSAPRHHGRMLRASYLFSRDQS